MMDWTEYVRDTIGGDTLAVAARRIGVSRSTVGRWTDGTSPTPQQAVALARAYGRSPTSALISAGYIEPGDIQDGRYDITSASDDELLEEVKRRFNR